MKSITAFFLFPVILCHSSCCRKTCSQQAEVNPNHKVVRELPRFQKSLLAADTLALNTDTLLYFQKSACFGFCPTYNYTLYQNGMVRYNGHQFVEPLGTRYALATDEWWKPILARIQQIDFFNLANIYPTDEKMYIPDLPNIIITIKEFGKRKSVIDNHDAPEALKDFEHFIEERFREIDFNKGIGE